MDYKEKYQQIYRRLLEETAAIVFIKADGTVRLMLGTKSIKEAELFGFDRPLMSANLNSHDKRCGVSNGNMSVIDLKIGEGRSFNIQRLVSITWYGEIETKEKADEVYRDFKEFELEYGKSRPKTATMDDLIELDSIN